MLTLPSWFFRHSLNCGPEPFGSVVGVDTVADSNRGGGWLRRHDPTPFPAARVYLSRPTSTGREQRRELASLLGRSLKGSSAVPVDHRLVVARISRRETCDRAGLSRESLDMPSSDVLVIPMVAGRS